MSLQPLPPSFAATVAELHRVAEDVVAPARKPDNDFTNRNTTFMTWNLMHLAAMLKQAGGIPAHGNQRSEWDAGCRFDYPNPEHR